MRAPIRPDLLYFMDKWLANRPDGDSLSKTGAELFGVTKTQFHTGLVGFGGAAAALGVMAKTKGGQLVIGLGAVAIASKLLFDYLEAPRQPR